ncbi:hypothetical protein DPMN_126994 [Dreissena polymorpha]|uniref:Uncharacterized protein n=1 Tax=Dreissena polymorpha TaxID=45954 RepID=A0A9D4GWU3_DREPO|nr:hypothetical protein DPMN_126994 [Dreissena polymorpha]
MFVVVLSITIGTDIDNQHSTFEYRAGANVEPALTSTFGKINIEQPLTSTFDTTLPLTFGKTLTSTFNTSPKYRAGANVEPALTSIFGKSLISSWGECRASSYIDIRQKPRISSWANVEPALTSTFGKRPEYRTSHPRIYSSGIM